MSSAKRRTWDVTREGRSLIYRRKRSGPRTDPCGTPEVTGTWSDLMPYTTTDWDLPIRKDWIQDMVWSEAPCSLSLYSNLRWLTLSKALLKLRRIKSVCYLMQEFLQSHRLTPQAESHRIAFHGTRVAARRVCRVW